MNNINTVIFDMDGVIVDGMPYHIKSLKEALLTINMSVSDLDIYLISFSLLYPIYEKYVSINYK